MIESLDTIVRLISIGASLLLLILLLAGDARRSIKVALGGLLISAIAYLINSSLYLGPDRPVRSFVDLASMFTPFWTWLFGRRLFEREPQPRLFWSVAAVLLVSWYAGNFVRATDDIGFYVSHFVSLALVVDLVRVAIVDRSDDLIEKRRVIRLWLPMLVAAQTGGVLLFETVVGRAIPYPSVQFANALLILALTLFAGLALLRTDPELLVETESDQRQPPTPDDMSPQEQVLNDRLNTCMADGYYRTVGLTIAGLADQLGVPEHRLRALINRRLGYRNFSAFLNRHRIVEACAILSDRDKVDLPVLTIAMDLGYNSLPTFNRAFRAEKGMTPTDYRRQQIAGSTDQN